MRGVTGPRPFRPMRVVRRRGVVRSDAVRNARAVPSQTATQNFEQLIILDPGSCYPRVLSTDNGSTPYDYLFMIFMSSDGAGLSAHTYHAAAVPEELCLEAWTVDSGIWLHKKPVPSHRGTKTRISQKRFNTPRRKRTESLEPVQVRRRRRLLRRLALLRLHALPVLLGNAGRDVGLDVDDR